MEVRFNKISASFCYSAITIGEDGVSALPAIEIDCSITVFCFLKMQEDEVVMWDNQYAGICFTAANPQ